MINTGNYPPLVGEALSTVAVRAHGKEMLRRGGALGRAAAGARRGRPIEVAAMAAARTGKGHIAELRQAVEFTEESGRTLADLVCRPNPVANDPHIDIEVLRGDSRQFGAQVGVGKVDYLVPKARRSRAPAVIVNTEAREAMRHAAPDAFSRTTDRLQFDDVAARPLSGEQVESEARTILERTLRNEPALGAGDRFSLVADAGAQSFVMSLGRGVLFELADAFLSGRSINLERVPGLLLGAAECGIKTALQSAIQVERFIAQAGSAYNAKLLHAMSKGSIWIGAVVEVIVVTAKDLVKWIRNEIDFEEVLRRAGVNVITAAGTGLAIAGASYVFRGAPLWAQLILLTLVACLAAWASQKAAVALLKPRKPTLPQPAES